MTRKRRKSAEHRRKRRAKAVKTLAAGAVIAAGTHAYASAVRFENPPPGDPAHFDWDENTTFAWERSLYVHLPSGQQGTELYSNYYGVPVAGSRSFIQSDEWYYYGWNTAWVRMGGNANVASDTGYYGFLWGFASGEEIGAAANWESGYYGPVGAKIRNPLTDFTNLPDPGVPGYLGVKIANLDGGPGFHYGWIGVIRNGGAPGEEGLQAFAWGYETEVGSPVAAGAPEPGTLAMLAFGAVALATRRKK